MTTKIEHSRVLVVWHDAHAINEGAWCDESDIDADPCVVETVGWLLADRKVGHVVLAQSVTHDGGLDAVLAIPVGMVQKIVVLGF